MAMRYIVKMTVSDMNINFLLKAIPRFILLCSCIITFCISAEAAKKDKKPSNVKPKHAVSKCHTTLLSGDVVPCKKSPPASLILDYNTGKVLHADKASEIIYPASLGKMMTLYLAFDALKRGKLAMNQKIHVSARAANMPPCKLFLKPGDQISVRDALVASIVKSANDTAVALGEAISGTEDKFAVLMTKQAKELGMHNTKFINASGWYHPDQKTTAIDLAKLAMAIRRDFPEHYHLFSKTSFEFRDRVIHGHNRVTAHYDGAEGMKTGFNNPAGCNLVTTASRDGKTLVGVVTGRRTGAQRDNQMMALLDQHFGEDAAQAPAIKRKAVVSARKHDKNKVVALNKKKSKHKRTKAA